MKSSIQRILPGLELYKADCLIFSSPANISYLTQYPSRDSYLIVSGKKSFYITDSRYTEEARRYLDSSIRIVAVNGTLSAALKKVCSEFRFKRIGFEQKYASYYFYRSFAKELGRGYHLVPMAGLVEDLRVIKSPEEIEKIRRATQITVEAFQCARRQVKVGKTELEIAAEIERFIRYHGAEKASFDIIVAYGPHASCPHHITSGSKLKKNEPVLIDMGVEYAGYKSDLTRVFFLDTIKGLQRKIYTIALQAQQRAIEAVKPGALLKEIDAIARNHIRRCGYGRFFGHSLGHGVGLQVHEAPSLSSKAQGAVAEGMVFTVEPGIYLPDQCGVRIEDMIRVTHAGCEVLSRDLRKDIDGIIV